METNKLILDIFEHLRQLRLKEKKQWNASAYAKAITSIKNYSQPITSGEQAMSLSNVGEKMAVLIDEIINTGTVKELNNYDFSRTEVIKLFTSLHDVGSVTAEKWYSLGYRKFEDVPIDSLTTAQRMALPFREELIQRIPRNEVQLVEKKLGEFLNPRGIYFEICGSYRRGRPDCGDIDVLILNQPDRDIKSEILQCPVVTHKLSGKDKKILAIGKVAELHRRIDFEFVDPENYPYAVVYFTGPGSFNTKMREHCLQHGLRLNQETLRNLETDKTYPVKTEQEVFNILGLQYLTPQQRDQY